MFTQTRAHVPTYTTRNWGGTYMKFNDCAGNQNRQERANVGINFSLHSASGSLAPSINDIPTKKWIQSTNRPPSNTHLTYQQRRPQATAASWRIDPKVVFWQSPVSLCPAMLCLATCTWKQMRFKWQNQFRKSVAATDRLTMCIVLANRAVFPWFHSEPVLACQDLPADLTGINQNKTKTDWRIDTNDRWQITFVRFIF